MKTKCIILYVYFKNAYMNEYFSKSKGGGAHMDLRSEKNMFVYPPKEALIWVKYNF